MKRLGLVLILLTIAGCKYDKRVQRQASYVNTITQVTKKEFDAAPTPEKKVEVADKYFKRIPKHTRLLDDYLHGRKPSGVTPKELEEAKKARAVKRERPDLPGE